MPVSKDNPPPSRKGRRNKLTGAHGDLIAAWDKVSGPETARKLMQAAVDEARGREVDVVGPDGAPTGKKKRLPPNFGPLTAILPYIARKMPETVDMNVNQFTPEALRIFVEEFHRGKH